MISRLGVLGGMFDPVHNGHIDAARYARDVLLLDTLKLIPCFKPNHREEAAASSAHRLQMLHLALANEPGLEVDAMEIERGGVSYTVESLAAIRSSQGAEQIVFVLGLDSFNTLTQWHRWQEILNLCHLFVLARQGLKPGKELAQTLQLDLRRVAEVRQLFAAPSGNILLAEDFNYQASSTEVRDCLRRGDDVSALLDPEVYAYIQANQLYN
jgi:nicotinate-nucleotide adenylyltransferase